MAPSTHTSMILDDADPMWRHDGATAEPMSTAGLRFRPDPTAWLAELDRRPDRCRPAGAHLRRAAAVEDQNAAVGSASSVGPGVRRVAVSVAVVIIMAVAWSIVGWLVGPGSGVAPVGAGSTAEAQTVVVVQPGDTLWSIAERLDPDGDVRATVDRLAERNGGTALAVGQRLVVAE